MIFKILIRGVILKTCYQNLTYSAKITSNVTTIKAVVDGFNLNIVLSSSNAFGLIFGPAMLTPTITIMVNRNDNPIQIWKGISKAPLPFGNAVYNNVSLPNNAGANSLNNTDNAKPVIKPAMAAAPVVHFQNIPNRNIANTPGLMKPVYF